MPGCKQLMIWCLENYFSCASESATALKAVSDDVKAQGYRLKIFDAYRPQRAVNHFVAWAKKAEEDPQSFRCLSGMTQFIIQSLKKLFFQNRTVVSCRTNQIHIRFCFFTVFFLHKKCTSKVVSNFWGAHHGDPSVAFFLSVSGDFSLTRRLILDAELCSVFRIFCFSAGSWSGVRGDRRKAGDFLSVFYPASSPAEKYRINIRINNDCWWIDILTQIRAMVVKIDLHKRK